MTHTALLKRFNEMAAKATPGPWAADKDPVFGNICVRQDPKDWDGKGYQYICQTPSGTKNTGYGEMFKANGNLIAAAPELLTLANAQAATIAELVACLRNAVQLKGGWREAIVELEDHCSEPVRLKNMICAADQLDDWSSQARALLERIGHE